MITPQSPCPCGHSQIYSACCGKIHAGSPALTAEQLMRARYSAYVAGKIEFISATNDPETGQDFDPEAAEKWSRESKWLGLEIIATRDGNPGDSTGEVEFKARYQVDDAEETHHEVSLFRKDTQQGLWYYRDGKTLKTPVVRATPKTGRNDPCPCGSGRKFKKCCASGSEN
jgi:SEC-C motif-containing protein